MLKVRLAHIKWIKQVIVVVKSEAAIDELSDMSYLDCEFGAWMTQYGHDFFDETYFTKVDQKHRDLHRIAHETMLAKIEHHPEECKALLDQLQNRSDELNTLLKTSY
jgi:hypothetical protein